MYFPQTSTVIITHCIYFQQCIRVQLPEGNLEADCERVSRDVKQDEHSCNKPEPFFIAAKISNLSQKMVGFRTQKGYNYDYILKYNLPCQLNYLELEPILYKKRNKKVTMKDFQIIRCLGIGGFSRVYLVRANFNGEFYAMKLMEKKFVTQNQKDLIVINEKEIMSRLNNPFIVKLHFVFESKSYVAFIMDYCAGGQLFYQLKKIKRMTEDQARFYFLQILLGIKYLHSQKIIYRDLKPQNLLIDINGHIKITDFGLSKGNVDMQELNYSFCGSTEYMPPQMILRVGHTFSVDYYCLGALLYQLVTGIPPYYSKDAQQIKYSILHEQLSFPCNIPLSSEIKMLLKNLLIKHPKQRLGTIHGIKQILFHPWFSKVSFKDVEQLKYQPPFLPDPTLFNFDQNQLGDNEQQYTEELMEEHKKDLPFKPVFKDIYYQRQTLAQCRVSKLISAFSKSKSRKFLISIRKDFSPYLQNVNSQKSLNHRQKSPLAKNFSLKKLQKIISGQRSLKILKKNRTSNKVYANKVVQKKSPKKKRIQQKLKNRMY